MKAKLIIFRVLSLVALAVCVAMLMDYILPTPAFCGFKAGCEEVTHSAFGKVLGVPIAFWGLAAFGTFFALTLFPASRLGKLIGWAAVLAGLGGMGFILLQVLVIRRVCPLCMIIDTSALLIAAVELGLGKPRGNRKLPESQTPSPPASLPKGEGRTECQPHRGLWSAALLVALAAAPAWTFLKPEPPVPETVKSLWVPDKVTVVEVTDFDCPHCRATYPALCNFLAEDSDKVQFVRFVLPMEKHQYAHPAARAHFAAQAQGKDDAMADALFVAEDLTPEGCEQLAVSLGLNLDAYRAAVADPATDGKIDDAVAWVDRKVHSGLPIFWIQDQRLVGEQTVEAFRAALHRAERQRIL